MPTMYNVNEDVAFFSLKNPSSHCVSVTSEPKPSLLVDRVMKLKRNEVLLKAGSGRMR